MLIQPKYVPGYDFGAKAFVKFQRELLRSAKAAGVDPADALFTVTRNFADLCGDLLSDEGGAVAFYEAELEAIDEVLAAQEDAPCDCPDCTAARFARCGTVASEVA